MTIPCICQRLGKAMVAMTVMVIALNIQSTMGFMTSPPRVASRPLFQTRLYAMNTDDPFRILNLEPDPSLDKKTIKRAYKRMALKFHPDVVTNKDSTEEEKKKANDVFARINWAYETLSGKNQEVSSAASGSTSSAGYGYTPPHRRTSSYSAGSTRTPSGSTNWEDYMPKYNDEDYDAGGDSFGAIFSDLFAGAAGAAAGGVVGGGGIFRDLVDFLERNVDGYSGGADDDAQLTILLQTGSVEEIGMEMDDTELVVQQLSSKLDNVEQELMTVTAQAQTTSRYLERLELEESAEELKARKKVSEGYLKKARKRLVKLQTRYKQLIVSGQDDFVSRVRSSRSTTTTSSSSSWDSGTSSRADTGRNVDSNKKDDGDSWKHEGFGSSGRGRGSSRRRSRSRRTAQRDTATSSDSFSGRTPAEPSGRSSQSSYSSSGPTSTRTASTSSSQRASPPPEPWTPRVPPHRRTSSAQSQTQADKRRMRELQVEDDFEKLKKELGL